MDQETANATDSHESGGYESRSWQERHRTHRVSCLCWTDYSVLIFIMPISIKTPSLLEVSVVCVYVHKLHLICVQCVHLLEMLKSGRVVKKAASYREALLIIIRS